jgi:DNA-directed RNA polymerase beta' subunit
MAAIYSRLSTKTLHPNKLRAMTAAQIHSFEKLEYSGNRDLQGILSTHALEASLSSFQDELRVIKLDQDRLCSLSLNGTLEHFLGLVNSVSESDTNLLNLAQDEAFNASELIDDSTDELLCQTDQLAERMKETANKFSKRLDNVKTLDANVTRFSVSEVSRYKDAIEEVIEKITTEIQKKSNEIDMANVEHRQTETQISNLNASINDAARRQSHHESARNAGIAVSPQQSTRYRESN